MFGGTAQKLCHPHLPLHTGQQWLGIHSFALDHYLETVPCFCCICEISLPKHVILKFLTLIFF